MIVSKPRKLLSSLALLTPILEPPWLFRLLLFDPVEPDSEVRVLTDVEEEFDVNPCCKCLLVALLPLLRFLLDEGAGSLGGLLFPFSLSSIIQFSYNLV